MLQKTRQATAGRPGPISHLPFPAGRAGRAGGRRAGYLIYNFKFDFETLLKRSLRSELYKFPLCARVVWRGSPQRDGFGFERGPFEGVSL